MCVLVHVFVILVRRNQGVGRLLVVIVEGIDLMASDANGRICDGKTRPYS